MSYIVPKGRHRHQIMQLINYKDPRPIFEQIVENFKMQILMGVLEQGEQMPSVRALAVELSANPNTVQKAYIILEQQGYIYSVKGKGNFVAAVSHLLDSKKEELVEKMRTLLSEAAALGFDSQELYLLAKEENGGEPLLRSRDLTEAVPASGETGFSTVVRHKFTERKSEQTRADTSRQQQGRSMSGEAAEA